MRWSMKTKRKDRPAGEAGFSLVETLIAAALLLIIALGMIPLFKRSIDNNALGNDYTQATSYAKTNLEDLIEIPFQSADMVLANGASSRTTVRYLQKGIQTGVPTRWQDWLEVPAGGRPVIWTRTTRVRQFGVAAYDDGILDDTEALPGGTDESFVQIQEISAVMDSGKAVPGRRGGLSAVGRISFQLMKPF
jgi:type II secretory pathway pseudopilin PulG